MSDVSPVFTALNTVVLIWYKGWRRMYAGRWGVGPNVSGAGGIMLTTAD